MGKDELFLVTIYSDPRLQRLLQRPLTLIDFVDDRICDVELIEKSAILCDACGGQVAFTEEDLEQGLPKGYALCDEECVIEVVCDDCRQKYFEALRVYSDLDDALRGGDG